MPRRRRSEQTSSGPKRVRTGCLTCRERHVKCTEEQPRCRNCVQRGLPCKNGVQLKWEQEFVSRGLAFGRRGRWAKKSQTRAAGPPTTPTTPLLSLEETEWCVLPLVRAHHFINTLYWEYDHALKPQPGQGDDPEIHSSSPNTLSVVPFAAASSPSIEVPGSPCTSLVSHSSGSAALLDPWSPSSPMQLAFSPMAASPSALYYSVSPYPALSSIDPGLFEYYLLRLCPLTTPSRLSPSPFAGLVVPVLSAPGHEDIQRAVLALAARHRGAAAAADADADSTWCKTAMTLRDGVLRSLRQRLANLAAAPAGAWDAQILILMMFLCLYEIVDSCDHRWVIHLRASQDIIRRSRQVQPRGYSNRWAGQGQGGSYYDGTTQHLGALTLFTERFFAFQDVISRAACENVPLFGQEYWDDAAATDTNTQQWGISPTTPDIDSWMGCSTALVRVLCRVTDLSRLKARRAISATEFEREAAALEQALEALKQEHEEADDNAWTRALIDGSTEGPAEDTALARSAELKRQAVVLYHHCVLYDASPSTPLVAELVREILEGTAELVAGGLAAGLLFPLFVAAVELDPLDNQLFLFGKDNAQEQQPVSGRRLVLEMLEAMARSSLSNIARTKAVVEKVWRVRDMALEGGGDEPSGRVLSDGGANDWGVFVGPYSSNISLA